MSTGTERPVKESRLSFNEELIFQNRGKALHQLMSGFEAHRITVFKRTKIQLSTALDFIQYAFNVRARLLAADSAPDSFSEMNPQDRDLLTMMRDSEFDNTDIFNKCLSIYADMHWGNTTEAETVADEDQNAEA